MLWACDSITFSIRPCVEGGISLFLVHSIHSKSSQEFLAGLFLNDNRSRDEGAGVLFVTAAGLTARF